MELQPAQKLLIPILINVNRLLMKSYILKISTNGPPCVENIMAYQLQPQAQRRFDKQAAKHHGFECLIPGVASMTL
jgi:hypothetical protein